LGAELHANAFRELEVLAKSHVPIVITGIAQTSLTDIAESTGGIGHECGWAKPIPASGRSISRTRSSTIRISYEIRPILTAPSSGAATIAVCSGNHGERSPALCRD